MRESEVKSGAPLAAPRWPKQAIEWPTMGMFFGSVLCAILSVFLYQSSLGWWGDLGSFFLSFCAVYFCFTLGHEGAHQSIAPGVPWLNRLVGDYSGLLFHIPMSWFRVVHLRHHAFVNQPAKDPDLHCAHRNAMVRIGLMLTTYFFYCRYLLKERLLDKKLIRDGIVHYAVLGVVYYWGIKTFGWGVVWIFTLPMFAALVVTVYVFDYLPHAPHRSTARIDNAQTYFFPLAGMLTQMHSYHIIHHLWPAIPWYRYGQVYRAKRKELLNAGAIERASPWNPVDPTG